MRFFGNITAPPSKSYEQRVLAGALLSKSICEIKNYGNSDDVITARNILEKFGCECIFDNGSIFVNRNQKTKNEEIINCNESGFCARLFASIACLFKDEFVIIGSKSLLKRNIVSDFDIFTKMGITVESTNLKLPVKFSNAKLKSGNFIIDGSCTSQVVSGLIMSLPLLEEDSKLTVKNVSSIDYIYLTIEILQKFGINIENKKINDKDLEIKIKGCQSYKSGIFEIEGDWSGAAFFLVAAAICGQISISGLNKNSIQADRKILNIFDIAEINYEWKNDNTIEVKKSTIIPFEFDANNCPDLIPILTILALFASGKSKIHGTKRLVNKESSRAEVLYQELLKIGANIKLSENCIEIFGCGNYIPAKLDSHSDHRIAMAFAILKSKINIEIENCECVTKSYPEFFKNLKDNLG